MSDKITLEDINTWIMKYGGSYKLLILDCSESGDYGTHIVSKNIGETTVVLKIPLNVKVYGNRTSIQVNQYEPSIIYTDATRLKVLLNQTNQTPICSNNPIFWRPIDNPNCLAFAGDLNHKLYLETSWDIEKVNGEDVQSEGLKKYITYNALVNQTKLTATPAPQGIELEEYSCNLQIIPSAPIIETSTAYRGNVNNISDLITLPSDNIEYKVYYQGKMINNELFIPADYEKDDIRLRIVTKSYDPYIAVDIFIDVPVETKLLTTIEDLNNYTYGNIGLLENLTGEINNDITIVKKDNTSAIYNCNLIINGNIELNGLQYIEQTLITNNSNLKITDTDINSKYNDGFEWVNNGTLTLDNVTIHTPSGFILNNDTLNLYNSIITDDLDEGKNLPFIHSTTSNYNIQNNTFELVNNKTGYDICLIRNNNVIADNLIINNDINYSCIYTHDDIEYTVNGNGVAYCFIDEDTIRFNNLEVT